MKKLLNFDLEISLGGELKRKLVPIVLKYSKISVFTMSLFIPILTIFLFSNTWFKWVGIIWIVWLGLIFFYNIFREVKNMNIVIFILTLPMSLPVYTTTLFMYNRLKDKYPNSDDPDYIKKFNRIAKIKQIL